MNLRALSVLTAAIAVAACSSNFGTGTSLPNTIPQGQMSGAPPLPDTGSSPHPESQATAPGTQSYSLADAQTGFACAEENGVSCMLRFNVDPSAVAALFATPAPPSKGKRGAKPTPTPTPTPTPSPEPTGSGSPTPTPTPAGQITLHLDVAPKDAPTMVHTPPNALSVVSLLDLIVSPSTNFTLSGPAIAQFTLPKEQLDGRGFALQLFERTTHRRHHTDRALYTFDRSIRRENTLSFVLTPPKAFTVPKGATYMLVLYGDEKPASSASPAVSASAAASSAPATSAPSAPATSAPSASPALR